MVGISSLSDLTTEVRKMQLVEEVKERLLSFLSNSGVVFPRKSYFGYSGTLKEHSWQLISEGHRSRATCLNYRVTIKYLTGLEPKYFSLNLVYSWRMLLFSP